MSTLTILPVGDHPAIAYAAEELARCLGAMTGEEIRIQPQSQYVPNSATGLWIGIASDIPAAQVPQVRDPQVDDAVYIAVADGAGILAGSNPRSALLAVYRYLTALGARWVRPGPDGEYLPQLATDALSARIAETPSYRHRGVCIEGAVSEEHVRHIIEWTPRVGGNAYFIQFREAYTFFDRWYSHFNNPLWEPEPFSVEQAREIMARLMEDIERRDLLYHAVGHGWTCEPFGLPGLGWDYEPVEVPPDVEPYLALVNGKRELWGGVPLNTNLCYSNPDVRRIVARDIAGYAEEHPQVDLLHIWLADGSNNHCECENCVRMRPADWYVRLLNETDRLLQEKGLSVRLVFLIYVDLLWPPEHERLRNPDRFILMFAPITRSYTRSFPTAATEGQLPPFERNRLRFPRSVEENVAFLRAWQRIFAGDSFDFDYHYMWDHYNDPGGMQLAAVMQEDIRRMSAIGLRGFISCQTQRACLPTGLGMTAMAWTLWRRDLAFDDIAPDYFRAAFGEDGPACRAYLERLSEMFRPAYLRGEEEEAPDFSAIPGHIAGFLPVIERNLHHEDSCRAASWGYLRHHADLCEALARAFASRAEGNADAALHHWREVEQIAREREGDLHNVLDVYLFLNTLGRRFAVRQD